MIIQFCGLSGAGKSTLAKLVELSLLKENVPVEVLDGDEYRKLICADLGFSKADRHQNILRLAFVASKLSKHHVVALISAINPYQHTREEVATLYPNVKTIHIDCPIETLIQRDTKGLYKKAMLPDEHPEKIRNLTGVNDPFEAPPHPDLYINTALFSVEQCTQQITQFVKEQLSSFKSVIASH